MGFGLCQINGRVDYTPKTAEVIYNCHLCAACDVYRKHAMEFDVLEPLYPMREECVRRGRTVPVWDRLVEGLANGAPLVLGARTRRDEWCFGLPVKDVGTSASAPLGIAAPESTALNR